MVIVELVPQKYLGKTQMMLLPVAAQQQGLGV
jgi:hypothetical protein